MTFCACGKELHYLSPVVRADIEKAIAEHGPDVRISDRGHTYLVPRHYRALHEIKPGTLASLGFPRVEEQEVA